MSFSAGGRGLRRGRDEVPVAPQQDDDDGESSGDEDDDDVEEGDEGGEQEEEEEQEDEQEEEEDEAEDAEGEEEGDLEVEDNDRTPDQEDDEADQGGEDLLNDTGDPQPADQSFDDDPSYDDAAADESYVDDEDEEEAEATSSSTPSAPAAAPFVFVPLGGSSASAASSFPSFSVGSAAGQSSSAPFAFPAPSSSSAPFAFPSTAALSKAVSGSSTAAFTPFTFGSTSTAPVTSTATPFTFSSVAPFTLTSAFQPPPPASASSSTTSSSSQLPLPSASTAASSSAPALPSTSASPAAAPSSAPVSGGVIPVPVAVRGVAGVWGSGSELFLYSNAESNQLPSRHHPPIPFHGSDIFRFQWPTLHGESSVLLHSWHAVFLTVQQQARVQAIKVQRKSAAPGPRPTLSPLEWRDFLLAQSHCYRAELDACLYRAAKTLSSTSTRLELARHRVSADEYHAHLLLLESAASTWHLFELVCLDSHENLTVQLVDWLQRSTPAPQTQGLQVDSDEWWTALLHLLVQGRLPAVVDLLTTAITSSSSPFSFLPSSALRQLVDLLQTLPSLTRARDVGAPPRLAHTRLPAGGAAPGRLHLRLPVPPLLPRRAVHPDRG